MCTSSLLIKHPCHLSLLLQLFKDSLLQRLRLGRAGPSALDLSVSSNKELLKVPLDTLQAHQTRLLLLEPLINGRGPVAVDIDLLHNGKADTIIDLAEVLDIFVGAGLLGAKLVAGEAEEDDVVGVLLLEGLVESLEAGVLAGEATLRGRVDDKDDFAFVVGKGNLLTSL